MSYAHECAGRVSDLMPARLLAVARGASAADEAYDTLDIVSDDVCLWELLLLCKCCRVQPSAVIWLAKRRI